MVHIPACCRSLTLRAAEAAVVATLLTSAFDVLGFAVSLVAAVFLAGLGAGSFFTLCFIRSAGHNEKKKLIKQMTWTTKMRIDIVLYKPALSPSAS